MFSYLLSCFYRFVTTGEIRKRSSSFLNPLYLDWDEIHNSRAGLFNGLYVSGAIPPSAPSASSESINPFITLLYRPGHYDISLPEVMLSAILNADH
ncbi:hypothetical protein NC651_000050 [Populus alba x Populus x berolinensis]|nr:hypothetical protein NC651_000050 [Populus alba x Populus x berolinensis]